MGEQQMGLELASGAVTARVQRVKPLRVAVRDGDRDVALMLLDQIAALVADAQRLARDGYRRVESKGGRVRDDTTQAAAFAGHGD